MLLGKDMQRQPIFRPALRNELPRHLRYILPGGVSNPEARAQIKHHNNAAGTG
jgi:hypothetical protein